MYIQVSQCPRCGAPIYVPAVWAGTIPPSSIYTCACPRPALLISTITEIGSGQNEYPNITNGQVSTASLRN